MRHSNKIKTFFAALALLVAPFGMPAEAGMSGPNVIVGNITYNGAVSNGPSGALQQSDGASGFLGLVPATGIAAWIATPSGANLAAALTSAVPTSKGGTGQTATTDGDLLIGNTATGLWSKAKLTAGANVTITNSNGGITIAATGGGGGAATNGTLGQLLTSDGAGGFSTALTVGAGVGTLLATPSSANLLAALTSKTGTGLAVFGTSPSLTTPNLGQPTVLDLLNATNLPIASTTGNLAFNRLAVTGTPTGTKFVRDDGALAVPAGSGASSAGAAGNIQTSLDGAGAFGSFTPGTGVTTFLTTPSSTNFRTILNSVTGTGAAVFATSPSFVTPALGIPSALDATNATNLPAAQLIGTISVNRFNSGTGASPSTVLHGDGTWGAAGGGTLTVTDTHGFSLGGVTTEAFGPGFIANGSGGSITVKPTNEITTSAAATYTVQPSDANTTVHLTNASPAVTVQAAATLGNGFGSSVQCDNACILTPASGTINGAASLTLAAHQTGALWTDGATTSAGIIPATDPSNASNLISGKVPNAQGGAGTLTGVLKATGGVVATAALSGNAATLATASGTLTSTHMAVFDANGNIIDGGAPSGVAPSGSANTPLFNNGSGGFTNGTRTGTTTAVATATGTVTGVSGHLATWDVNGNLQDGGSASAGSGTVNSGTANQLAFYATTGPAVSGNSHVTDDGTTVTFTQAVALSGTVNDTIAADQNNYAPSGIATAAVLLIDGGTADRTLTGLTTGVDGRRLIIVNKGTTNSIIVSSLNGSSSAANQFSLDASTSIPPNNGALPLMYAGGAVNKWLPAGRTHQTVDYVVGWAAGVSPNKFIDFRAPRAMLITGITGTVGDAVGAVATITVRKVASGSTCATGTALHTGTFNANGTAATDQTLTLSATVSDLQLATGDRVCLDLDGTSATNMAAGTGNGVITVSARAR